MHITFVVEHCNFRGGHERCVAEWATRLARRHRVRIVSLSLADVPSELIEWRPVRTMNGPAAAVYLSFYLRAGAAVRGLKDTVIHSQGPNCPRFHVSSIHTVIRAKWDILKSSREFRGELTQKQYLSWNLHYWLASRIEALLYTRPQGTLAPVSEGAALELKTIYGTKKTEIQVVPNGVDIDAFTPGTAVERQARVKQLGLDPAKQYALFVGGEWARKGLPFALDVIASCPSNIHLIVAGNGPVSIYQRRAVLMGVSDRIHFIGTVRNTASLYKAGLALLMPSLYEAFSLVSLEAAASGLPLLATAVNGTSELIATDENGWILPTDVSTWGDCLTALSADHGRAFSMGKRSREIVSEFTWDRAVKQFEEIYDASRIKGHLR